MIGFKGRFCLSAIWLVCGTQLLIEPAHKIKNSILSQVIETSSQVKPISTMVRTKTQTISSRDQRQEARQATVAKALIKARGDSAEAARELLEKERKKMLIKQEELDAAFVQELIANEMKAKAAAQDKATTMHSKTNEEVKKEEESRNEKGETPKPKVQAGNPGGDDDDDDPDDDDDSKPPKKQNTPMKRKDKGSDPEDSDSSDSSVDLKTPPKRKKDKKRNKKKKKRYESSDSESEGSPVAFARNPNKVCTGILNYKKKAHYKIYEAATKSLYADTADRYDLDVVGAINLLQKINDRCSDLGLKIIKVPANDNALEWLIAGHDTIEGVNLCLHHGHVKKSLIRAYVKTFVNSPCREAQEDDMLCIMLQNSLTEKAYQTVTRDPSAYTVEGEKSGLMLLKTILEQSAVDSSIDPDVIRKELAHAYLKFKELKFDVRLFHDWVQQKLNALKQTGHTSTDVATHLLTAYRTSTDEKLRLYIDRLEDSARESGEYLQVKSLMNNVKMKYDALETSRRLEAVAKQDDQIVALKAQLKDLKKKQKGEAATGGTTKSKKKRKEKEGTEKKKFPKELKKKPEPSDLTKPLKIDGADWWYCKKHKWCKHKNADCRGINRNPEPGAQANDGANNSNASTQPTVNPGGGDRAGRTLRAVGAVVAE
jgi:hypothetical protein